MEPENCSAGLHALHLHDPSALPHLQHVRGAGYSWAAQSPDILLHVAGYLDAYALSKARCVCKPWRSVFGLKVQQARLDVGEGRSAQARAFMQAFMRAFPSTNELVMEVSFRRTAREKIQAALDEHFQALRDFGLQALQLNLDLNSFNERKIKLPDMSHLATWASLTRLTLQVRGEGVGQVEPVSAAACCGAKHLPPLL